jgi:hypothetical protein
MFMVNAAAELSLIVMHRFGEAADRFGCCSVRHCDGEDSPTFLAAMSEMTLLLELVLLSTAIQGEGF